MADEQEKASEITRQFDPTFMYFMAASDILDSNSRVYEGSAFEDVEEAPEYLNHYTTAEGLQGIVENGCLWASAAPYLNDSSELEYGQILFLEVLKSWTKKPSKQMTTMGRSLLKTMTRILRTSSFPEIRRNRTYVTCFCEEKNLLSQWRAYGQRGGYSIGFRQTELRDGFSVAGEGYEVVLGRVVYDKKTQVGRMIAFLRNTLPALAEAPDLITLYAGLADDQKENGLFLIGMSLIDRILGQVAVFKHPAFAEEKEWRLIAHTISPNPVPAEVRQLKFRASQGILTPYVEMRPREGKLLPIDYVRSGPTLDKNRAHSSTRLLLEKAGYKGFLLYGSNIPVRL